MRLVTHLARAAAVASFAAAVAVVPAAGATGGHSCSLPRFGPGSEYHPHFDRTGHSARIDNVWSPMPPGRTLVYTGTKDGKSAVDVVVVSSRTRVVDRVTTRVVEDRLYLDGVLEERTSDYFAQDRCGNVWYFGEDTAELDRHGHVVSTEGSFHAGVDGAEPGVVMQADPELGRRFRQEWYRGHAEDTFAVIARNETVRVPAGTFRHVLRTEETTRLEPEVVDNKFYARGIGEVEEVAVRGDVEKLVLVDVID